MNTAHFKGRLEAEKATLERELAGVGEKNLRVPGEYEARASATGAEPDVVDQADTIRSYEENEGILRDLDARYEHVLAALARLEDGSYGTCTVGGERVEADRLEADPAASTCKKHLK